MVEQPFGRELFAGPGFFLLGAFLFLEVPPPLPFPGILRGLFCRSVTYQRINVTASAKKKMPKRKEARNRRTSNNSSSEVDEAAGQAWLPVVVPGDSKLWGKSSRSYAEITKSLEPPGGAKTIKRRKSASYQGRTPPTKLSKSEHQRMQG